jgi:TfoX/Sxy family transcriptional regulator of competence genes
MSDRHVSDLRSLLDRLTPRDAIACKRFFGGAAAYVEGRIFMTLTPVGLALKLPADTRATLLAAGARPLKYFPKAPVKKEYVVLPDNITGDAEALAALVATSLSFVLARPKTDP